MKIVIDINKKEMEMVKNSNKALFIDVYKMMVQKIQNGTPLPKGHGNLIDYDDLIAKLDRYDRKDIKYQLPYSPTIISADKENE